MWRYCQVTGETTVSNTAGNTEQAKELLPCPFCDRAVEIEANDASYCESDPEWLIGCCGTMYGATKDILRAEWNTRAETAAIRAERDEALRVLRADYDELLMAVEHKYPNETRHQTALRYIEQAETSSGSDALAAARGFLDGKE